jgi:hypothetical protein
MISYSSLCRFPLSMLPMMITSAVQASVSVKRINTFMRSDELEPGLVKRVPLAPDTKDAVTITGASFRWETTAATTGSATAPAAAKSETNGASSKTNGKLLATVGEEEEETDKLLKNGSAITAEGSDSPREVFSLKDINVR